MEKDEIDDVFSTKYACPHCGYSLSALEPKFFSFNSPAGACSTCDGLGVMEFFDPAKIITNEELSLSSGAIYGWDKKNAFYFLLLDSLAIITKLILICPIINFQKNSKRFYFMEEYELIDMKYVKGYRSKNMDNFTVRTEIWDGIIQKLEKQYENGSYSQRERLVKYLSVDKCKSCNGKRLNESSRNVLLKTSL